MLILWCIIATISLVIKVALGYRMWRSYWDQAAFRYLFVSNVGSVTFNALVVIIALRAADNAQIGAPPSLNVMLLTLAHAIQMATSVAFSAYVLGLLNGGQPKIKDVNHV